jgi:YVTN family beta-propeller protein
MAQNEGGLALILSKRNEATILRALVAVTVIGAIGIIYLVARTYVPTPAAIISSAGVVDSGGTVAIGVSWNGGQAPYTLNLYSSPSPSCTTASNLIAQKANQPSPQGTFAVSPTEPTYYCASVTGPTGSSGISPVTEVLVNPALGAPKLVMAPVGVDVGQAAYVQAKVFWQGGTSPFTVTLLSGQSTTCSSDTTVVAVSSGTNPVKGLSVQAFNFTFAAPASTTYYCASIQEDSISSTLLISSPLQFDINPLLSASVLPGTPRVDQGQGVTLTASPAHGTPPYTYQWFTGATCASGSQIASSTGPKFTASGLTATTSYSVQVSDASTGTPLASPCAKATVAVNSAFSTNAAVQVAPAGTLDSGMIANLTVSWTTAGTPPYAVQLTTSPSPTCGGATPVKGANATSVSGTSASFSNAPAASVYYCATVTDSATLPETAVSASGADYTVNPALSLALTLAPAGLDVGQTATVSATVAITGGTPPFSVTLTSGSSSICSSDTTKVAVTGGSNPAKGVTSASTTFQFPAPAAATYYCASVTDSLGLGDASASTGIRFGINPVLSASISPASPTIVSGKSITLNAVVAPGTGTAPFTYQWYLGASCPSGGRISGQTASSFSTGALSVTTAYSVTVTDSSTGTPTGPGTACASATVTVTAPLTVISLNLSPSTTDVGQGVTISAIVNWAGGTPPYSVTVFSGTSATCTSDTSPVTVSSGTNPATGVTATTATLTFASPPASTYYCATVKDSAVPAASAPSTATHLTVNLALSTPVLKLTPAQLDVGQTATVQTQISYSGGTPPYTVSLYTGSSTTCTSDTILLKTESGVSGVGVSFSFSSPSSTTYYCAVVKDNATNPITQTSASFQFLVNPSLVLTVTGPSPSYIDVGQLVSSRITVSWTGGTAPFTVSLYASPRSSCGGKSLAPVQPGSNPVTQISVQSTTFTFNSPAGTTYYCATVIDSSSAPENVTTSPRLFLVSPTLVAPIVKVAPTLVDQFGLVTLTIQVPITGGTPPYDCKWYSTGPPPATFSGLSTQAAKYCTTAYTTNPANTGTWKYQLQVVDNSSTPVTVYSGAAVVTVNTTPSLTLGALSLNTLDQGQSAVVSVLTSWTGGTAPFNITLYGGSSTSCSSDTAVITKMTNVMASQETLSFNSPASTTNICATLTDSATPPNVATAPPSSVAPDLFTVNPPLVVNAPTFNIQGIDVGQSKQLSIGLPWTGGTKPYAVTLYSGLSPSCALDTTVVPVPPGSNPQTGILSASLPAPFLTPSPSATTYYCASVADTSNIPVTVDSPVFAFNVNALPAATLGSLTPLAVDSGQRASVSSILSWTGGTPPFTVQIFSSSTPSCSSSSTPVGGTLQSQLTVSSVPVSFTSAALTGSTYYCGVVTDSSSTPESGTSGTQLITVYQDPTVAITPSSPTIAFGASVLLQAVPALGTTPYMYQWYAGGACPSPANPISGQTSQNFNTGNLYVTTTFLVQLTDSSPGTPGSDGQNCASVQVTVRNGPSGPGAVASNPVTGRVYVAEPNANHISVINNATNSVVAIIPVGSQPWSMAVDTVANLIYVANLGSGSVSVINGATNTVINTIPLGTSPWGIALNQPAGKLYVTDATTNDLYIVNTTTETLITTVAVGASPHGVAFGPAPTYTVFVANYGSNDVTVVDPTYHTTTVGVGGGPWGVAVNTGANMVYVTNSNDGTVSVINGYTYAVSATISSVGTPQGITMDLPRGLAYVTSATGTIYDITLATNAVASEISSGLSSPGGLAFIPGSPGWAYISNSGTNTVSVVQMVPGAWVIKYTVIVS